MNAERPTDDLSKTITVDWEAVETDLDLEIDDDLRAIIEHEGSTSEISLDKWGRGEDSSVQLFTAVNEHGRVVLPDRGALDARYAPLRQLSSVTSVMHALRGRDLNLGTIIDDGDDEEFLNGFADLYDSARALDEQATEWVEDGQPSIQMGSYGPDLLGNHYIAASHADRDVLENLSVAELPIENERTRAEVGASGGGEPYTAIFRHERYYPPAEPEPTEADERAEEIGFLGANAGKTSLVQAFEERGHEYREREAPDVDGIHRELSLYEYEKGEETRYAVEWSQRVTIDDYVLRSLVFDHDPTESDVQTALLIEQSRQEQGRPARTGINDE